MGCESWSSAQAMAKVQPGEPWFHHLCLRNALWKVWIRCQSLDSPPSLQFPDVTAVPEYGLCSKKWSSPPCVLTHLGPDFFTIRSTKNGLGWNLSAHLLPAPCHGQGHPPLDQVTQSSPSLALDPFRDGNLLNRPSSWQKLWTCESSAWATGQSSSKWNFSC